MDINPCEFLMMAMINEVPLSQIKEHLETCVSCNEELDEEFSAYKICGGDISDLVGFEIPLGITTRDQYLELMHRGNASKGEVMEHTVDQFMTAITNPQVVSVISKLFARQTSAIKFRQANAPTALLNPAVDLVGRTYRQLRELMGARAFWFLIDPNGIYDEDLEAFISGWRNTFLGARK